jgi:predicted unusual protein kinase regulating ubiquinone biosynthesis (AarF/ABC1/UbiB family)
VGISVATSALQGNRGRTLIDSSGKVLADALAEAGPTYSKFGQALSCRPDIVGEGVAAALQELQDRVPPFDHATARRIISEELGEAGRELLDTMGQETVAAATLGQVYKAKAGGKAVAVKVQRPGVMQAVAADSLILRSAAGALEMLRNPLTGQRLIKPALVDGCDEFFSRLFEESDYEREAENLAKFAAIYGGVEKRRGGAPRIVVPDLYRDLSARRVITMEWVEGTRLTDKAVVDARDLPTLRLGIECSLSQCLETGKIL